MNDKEKTKELLKRLMIHCISGFNNQKVCITEMPYHCGYGANSRRRADLFTLTIENQPKITTYEIKVSRQDFLKDIKQTDKQKLARLFSHYFYYVTPEGLLDIEEIPLWAGLIEIDINKQITLDEYNNTDIEFAYKKDSPQLEPMPPTWGLVISAIRHSQVIFKQRGTKFIDSVKEIQEKIGGSVDFLKKKESHEVKS